MGKKRRKAKRNSFNSTLNWLGLILVGVIIISFFLPWLDIKVGREIGVWKLKSGITRIDITLSGYHLPQSANEGILSLFLPVAERYTGVSNLGIRAYLVYLFPLAGIVCFVLLIIGNKQKWADFIVLLIAGGLSGVGLYKVCHANMDSLLTEVTISTGLWLTLFSFAGFAIIGSIKFFSEQCH